MGDTPHQQDIEAVTRALTQLVNDAGGVEYLYRPAGHEHLGLAILDSLLSLRLNYGSVTKRLKTYCGHVDELDWSNLTVSEPEHDAQRLVETLESLSADERFEIFGDLKAPGTNTPRIEAVLQVANNLLNEPNSIRTKNDLLEAQDAEPDSVKQAITRVSGVGPAAWRYILNLSGVQAAKPDTMVVRWVERALDGTRSYSQYEIGNLFESAVESLKGEFTAELTVRTADHLVWRKESGRSISIKDETT